MLFTNQEELLRLDEEYEEIEVTIGQLLKYFDSNGIERTGKLLSVDAETGYLKILTGDVIQYVDNVYVDDLIEG